MQAAARKAAFPLEKAVDTKKQNIIDTTGVKNENDWIEFRVATKIQSVRAERQRSRICFIPVALFPLICAIVANSTRHSVYVAAQSAI